MSLCLSLCFFVCPVAVTFALVVFSFSVYTFWKVLIRAMDKLFFIFWKLSTEFWQKLKVFAIYNTIVMMEILNRDLEGRETNCFQVLFEMLWYQAVITLSLNCNFTKEKEYWLILFHGVNLPLLSSCITLRLDHELIVNIFLLALYTLVI